MMDKIVDPKDFDYHGPALDTVFETYQELRGKCPVGHSEKHGGFWFLTRNEDIFAAEQDPATFAVSPSMLMPAFGTDVPLIPIDIDPPEHTDYRRVLLPLFTPRAVAKLNDGMHETARKLAEAVAEGEVVDASALFARPMPTIIFSRLAGFPEKDWPMFDQWIDDIIYERTDNPERAYKAGSEVMDYFDELLKSREGMPKQDDLIEILTTAEVNGRKLTHDELLSYCYLLFLAGLDTTAWAIRSSLWYLAQNPVAQKQLREDRTLIPAAVEEFLRTLSPVQGMARTCQKDTVVSGQEIKEEIAWSSSSAPETATPRRIPTPTRSSSTARTTDTSPSVPASTAVSGRIWAVRRSWWPSRSSSEWSTSSRSRSRTRHGTASGRSC